MRKINITNKDQAREYLVKVLSQWNEFTRTHNGIKEAVELLIDHPSRSGEQIRNDIIEWVHETQQNEVIYLIGYLIGYYGSIDLQTWEIIRDFTREGFLK